MPVFATGAAKAATDDIAPSSAAKMINSISSLPRKVKKAIYSKKEEKKEEKEPGDEVMALAILPLEWNGNQVAIQCLVSEDGALNGAVYSWKKEEKKKKNTIEGIELALSDSLQKKEDHMKEVEETRARLTRLEAITPAIDGEINDIQLQLNSSRKFYEDKKVCAIASAQILLGMNPPIFKDWSLGDITSILHINTDAHQEGYPQTDEGYDHCRLDRRILKRGGFEQHPSFPKDAEINLKPLWRQNQTRKDFFVQLCNWLVPVPATEEGLTEAPEVEVVNTRELTDEARRYAVGLMNKVGGNPDGLSCLVLGIYSASQGTSHHDKIKHIYDVAGLSDKPSKFGEQSAMLSENNAALFYFLFSIASLPGLPQGIKTWLDVAMSFESRSKKNRARPSITTDEEAVDEACMQIFQTSPKGTVEYLDEPAAKRLKLSAAAGTNANAGGDATAGSDATAGTGGDAAAGAGGDAAAGAGGDAAAGAGRSAFTFE